MICNSYICITKCPRSKRSCTCNSSKCKGDATYLECLLSVLLWSQTSAEPTNLKHQTQHTAPTPTPRTRCCAVFLWYFEVRSLSPCFFDDERSRGTKTFLTHFDSRATCFSSGGRNFKLLNFSADVMMTDMAISSFLTGRLSHSLDRLTDDESTRRRLTHSSSTRRSVGYS
jgi:hypothetical protein